MRLAFLPSDAPAWDDGSNNRWLVSGKGALIMNPPSAWAVAKRDAPKVAEQCWTHGFPAGPAGRFGPFLLGRNGVVAATRHGGGQDDDSGDGRDARRKSSHEEAPAGGRQDR